MLWQIQIRSIKESSCGNSKRCKTCYHWFCSVKCKSVESHVIISHVERFLIWSRSGVNHKWDKKVLSTENVIMSRKNLAAISPHLVVLLIISLSTKMHPSFWFTKELISNSGPSRIQDILKWINWGVVIISHEWGNSVSSKFKSRTLFVLFSHFLVI